MKMSVFSKTIIGTAVSIVCSVVLAQVTHGGSKADEEAEWKYIFDWLSRPKKSANPKNGFVPDEKSALIIGEAVATGLYGAEALRQRPYRARLRGGIWTVMGTLNPPGVLGGVAIIQIQKADGKVVFAIHTQ